MKQELKELQRLKGVGDVLSRRLAAAGYDTLAKIAAADREGLSKIPGINPRLIPAIVAQAGDLAGEKELGRAAKVKALRDQATSLKEQVEELAKSVRDRFQEEAVGKLGKRTEREILKLIASLEKVEVVVERRVRKAGKGLVKAERRLEGLADAGLKGVGKGLRKARKSLQRVLAKP